MSGRGRPASDMEHRYMIRHHTAQKAAWETAAATSGLPLPEWIRETLDAEAKVATHVPMIKRRSARTM